DPYFVMYKHLAKFIGAAPALIDTYPDFRLRREALEAAWNPRCKMLIINSPNNPTGMVYSREELAMAARFADEKGLIVLTDEIYEDFVFDGEFDSPANYTDPARTIILSGLSKNVAMTGWRLGWVAAPRELISALSDIQQYSFVCAPSVAQYASFAGLEHDMAGVREQFTARRNLIYESLRGIGLEVQKPGGAFYVFPKAPVQNAEEFIKQAIRNELLVVPGSVFSERNSHFRISFAAAEDQLERGVKILEGMMARVP
ncbi:aminotransferase class I/II-fold pyridoxal phosphate-dependent enzyme, partial [Candidatus Poribacteria bacterium]|nr:aminotransferase class I/II-fold pyridoxal phosphate-dependent enzyme [Candidatus Poribacteria bacterium]